MQRSCPPEQCWPGFGKQNKACSTPMNAKHMLLGKALCHGKWPVTQVLTTTPIRENVKAMENDSTEQDNRESVRSASYFGGVTSIGWTSLKNSNKFPTWSAVGKHLAWQLWRKALSHESGVIILDKHPTLFRGKRSCDLSGQHHILWMNIKLEWLVALRVNRIWSLQKRSCLQWIWAPTQLC